MPEIKFLANLNISPQTIATLRIKGWSIIRVSEVLSVKNPDIEIIHYAQNHDMVIITQDLDYSLLLAVNGFDKPSVVSLRMENVSPDLITARLLEVIPEIENELSQGSVVSVDETSARFKRLPIGSE